MVVMEKLTPMTKCRVHLHVHLDGAVRIPTIWELSRQKKLPLPGDGSVKDLEEALAIRSPRDLAYFLSKFKWISPALIGDLDAIERVAYEFVEDEARQGVVHTEPRFNPHLLTSAEVSARQVTEAALRGLQRGEQRYGITARVILTAIRGMSENYNSVLDLCTEFRGLVVGLDVAGDEITIAPKPGDDGPLGEELRSEIAMFQEAARRGIHRTVHAGEAGPAGMIRLAVDEMAAERIGHGYHVLEDEALYRRCLNSGVHFECCPTSSFITGAVPLTQTRHPLQKFCRDGLNFSVSEDDPTLTQVGLDGEHALLRRMGFNEADITTLNFNAAKASFLPEDEKKQLIKRLKAAYGVPETN